MASDKLDVFEGMEGSDLIQDTFLFKQLAFDEAAKLAGHFKERKYGAGDHIIEENALGDGLYIIKKGKVKVVKSDGKGEQLLVELGEGELVGEMSLIEAQLTSASVVAKGKVECLVLSRSDLDRMMKDSPAFALKVYVAFCHVLSERLRRTSQELFELRQSKGA
jgi:CRP/FNR family transcriptional regulator